MIRDPRHPLQTEWKSFADARDVDEFGDMVGKYERGEIDADQFKEFRLTRGVYGQRQGDTHMIRVKIPLGILNAAQLRVLGKIAREKSRGFGHVTTRQNVQFHMVKLADSEPAMRELADVGITTREACGNTVRNITACAMAGVCRSELFDVTRVGEGVTRFLLRHPDAQSMPRKFKIAFSGCVDDCAFGAIHDIGFVARLGPGGEPGFRVLAGGGLATHPTPATEVEEFLPAEEAARCALAIVRVQQRFGERKNRGRARLKYTLKRLGVAKFLEEYRTEFGRIVEEGNPRLEFPEGFRLEAASNGNGHVEAAKATDSSLARWAASNVVPQRQKGFVALRVRLPIGDITADQFDGLAGLVESAADGSLRATIDQNLVIRWVSADRVHQVYQVLLRLGLADPDAGAIDDPTCCPGADTCNLAITHSRRLAKGLGDALPSLKNEKTKGLTVKISGCPNSCGQHHIASIGFHGSTARAVNQVIPVYQLHLGGGVDATGVTFGRVLDKIPVHRVNEAVKRLLDAYRNEGAGGETALEYFRRLPAERVTEILGGTVAGTLTEARMEETDRQDIGTGLPFRVMTGKGECAS